MELVKVLCYILVLIGLTQAAPKNRSDATSHDHHRNHRASPFKAPTPVLNKKPVLPVENKATVEDKPDHLILKANGLGENVTITVSHDGTGEFSIKDDTTNDTKIFRRSLSNKTRSIFAQDPNKELSHLSLVDSKSVVDVNKSDVMHHCGKCQRQRRSSNETFDHKGKINVTVTTDLPTFNHTGNITNLAHNRTVRLAEDFEGNKTDTKIRLTVKDDRMQITLDAHRPSTGSHDLYDTDSADTLFNTPSKNKTRNLIKREGSLTGCQCSIAFMKNDTMTRSILYTDSLFNACNKSLEESRKDCVESCKMHYKPNESSYLSEICTQVNTTRLSLSFEAKACNTTHWGPSYDNKELCCIKFAKVNCTNP